ncbi:hypothetical protein E2C01_061772 [Portunus trituberculatus]|uniref:Uncharacterized protein n=1 Tax=Portunus trituberculatus TaxID=210409 RepID=A0A5B7HDB2_PORTR|nr:hypothetical protein [Portunus trituberculatus]
MSRATTAVALPWSSSNARQARYLRQQQQSTQGRTKADPRSWLCAESVAPSVFVGHRAPQRFPLPAHQWCGTERPPNPSPSWWL